MDRDQLKEFVTHGVVSLPSFLTAAQLQNYRDQAWRGLSAEENGGENLLDGRGGGKALDLTPSLDELPQMRALIEQIGGGRFTPEVPLPLLRVLSSPRPLLPGSLINAGWGGSAARTREDKRQVQGHPPGLGGPGPRPCAKRTRHPV